MAELKKDHYHCVGGPLTQLFLPWPRSDTPAHEHLPLVVDVDGGFYQRVRNGHTYRYEWQPHDPTT